MSGSLQLNLQKRSDGSRLLFLDGLRGVTACVVVLHHFRLCFVTGQPRWFLRPFFAGTASVVVFFVLSGYVLSIPYWYGKQLTYSRYLVRRFFRIYVPYAVALLVALFAAHHFLYSHLPLTPWFYGSWQSPLTSSLILRHFFTIPGTGEINGAFWSLRYELEFSIILPVLCPLIMRGKSWWSLAATILIGICGRVLMAVGATHSSAFQELASTLVWMFCFLCGVLLSWQHKMVGELYTRLPRPVKFFLLVAAIAVLSSMTLMLLPIAACILVLTAQHTRIRGWLTTPVPEYLGRVSYSVYLLHATVLYTVVNLFYGKVSFIALTSLYLVATFAVSHIFCLVVEERAIFLGRKFTSGKPASRPSVVNREFSQIAKSDRVVK